MVNRKNELLKGSEAEYLALRHKHINDLETTKHPFKIICTLFLITSAINELIASENVDFVVMGSNSFKAIQTIKEVPLLIIPNQPGYKGSKKTRFASGFKRTYSKKKLNPLTEITILFNAKLQ